MSTVHVAFEINPSTHHVLISVRSKRTASITFGMLPRGNGRTGGIVAANAIARETIIGDGVILYHQNYHITIAFYAFRLIWRSISETNNGDTLKDLAVEGYQNSLQRLKELRSRDRPTETGDSEALSWHITRLRTTKGPRFQDILHLRNQIGKGAFGEVYSAIDQASAYQFPIKVVLLDAPGVRNIEDTRAYLHREIKVMEKVRYVCAPQVPSIYSQHSHSYFLATHHRVPGQPTLRDAASRDFHALSGRDPERPRQNTESALYP